MAPSSTIPAMPRSTAAVAIRFPIAAMSSDPFHDDYADLAGLRLVDHLDRVLGSERGRRLIGWRGPGQRRHRAAHHVGAGHPLHVIAPRSVLAGDEFDGVGDGRGIAVLRMREVIGAVSSHRSIRVAVSVLIG
jgi:hypothetical protein